MRRDEFLIVDEVIIMRYWCISTSAENWEICKSKGVWGMDARYFVTLEKYLKGGDRAVVYVHGGKFVVVIEFVGEYFYCEKDIGWKKDKKKFLFPYRINFRIIHESKNPPKISYSTEEKGGKANHSKPNLIDKITFIADKGKIWNQYLQVSIIRITEEDFNTIYKAIMESNDHS